MKELLLEGGVGGHMSHIHENRSLTYNKVAKILSLASRGELIGTEKVDGYNIYLGYQNGQPRAARNKTDMRTGGMSMEQLAAREFKGGPRVKKVYLDSFEAYSKAVNSLNPEDREGIFGKNGEIYYNTEILGPLATNVINYDDNIISIHHAGHKAYKSDTDELAVVDAKKNSDILDSVIDRFEQLMADQSFSITRSAMTSLNALDNDSHLKVALQRMKAAGFEGDMTIEEFLSDRITIQLRKDVRYLHHDIIADVVGRILKKEGFKTVSQIYKGFKKPQKELISKLVNSGEGLINKYIFPIEDAIHDFAVKMLEGLESAYILDNSKEVERIRNEVGKAVKNIQQYSGPGQEEATEVLVKQLSKLKNIENVSTAVEGFVFEFEGQVYKFTGNFAPINQILGLFRYGRGSVPAIQSNEVPAKRDEEPDAQISETEEAFESIALIPGAFKPPHRGHLNLAEYYATKADKVIVLISSPLKDIRALPSGQVLTSDISEQIWNAYPKSDNIEVRKSDKASPVSAVYDFIESGAPRNATIILGCSEKGDDASRFKSFQRYAREDLEIEVRPCQLESKHSPEYMRTLEQNQDIAQKLPSYNKKGLDMADFHGSDMREIAHLAQKSPAAVELLKDFLPEGAEYAEIMNILGLSGESEMFEGLTSMISAILDEEEKIQRIYRLKHKKNRMATKGKTVKEPPFVTDPPKQRSKSAPPLEEVDEIDEISSVGGGSAHMGPSAAISGKKVQKKKKKSTKFKKEDELVEKIISYITKSDIGVAK